MAEQLYRVENEYAFTQAVIAILQYARSTEDEFSCGPSNWAAAEQQGLKLSGTIDGAKRALAKVPGVVEADA